MKVGELRWFEHNGVQFYLVFNIEDSRIEALALKRQSVIWNWYQDLTDLDPLLTGPEEWL